MPSPLFRDTENTQKISHLTFCVESADSIEELSHMQVVSMDYYNLEKNRAPAKHGLLDPRMGASRKDIICETCGKNSFGCTGHFGYIDLNVPLYHPGFFTKILNILHSICKECSHVLLSEKDREKFVRSLSNPNLSYHRQKQLYNVILTKCKKTHVCHNCNYFNGQIKKHVVKGGNSFNKFSIIHSKNIKKDNESKEKVAKYNQMYNDTEEMDADLMKSLSTEIFTPISVLELFKSIPEDDILFLCMNSSRSKPQDLIMTKMLVPPVCVRPSVVSTLKDGTMEDDLTAIQGEILKLNYEFAYCKGLRINPTLYNDRYNNLQLKAATFFDGEISGIPLQYKMEKRKGLRQRLAGKKGRFRSNLSGKRVNFSARTVISPDPNLEIDQVGVPKDIAKILTFTQRVNKINIDKMRQLVLNGPYQWPGAQYIVKKNNDQKVWLAYVDRSKFARELKEGDLVERHMEDNDMVLMNRQPSLHRLSIMSHRVKVHNHRTFRINECVCNPYNADFDGDEMNLHLPQTEEAKAEAYSILNVKNNLITPKNGEILIAATQDFLSGAFAITRRDRFYTFRQVNQLLSTMLGGDDINMDIDVPEPAIMKPKRLWTGKQLFSLILRPNQNCNVKVNLEVPGKSYTKNREYCKNDSYIIIRNSEVLAGTLDKSHLGSGGRGSNIFYILLKDFKADSSIKVMWRLARMASYHLMNTSGFSIGIGDVIPNERLIQGRNTLLEKGYDDCHELIRLKTEGRLQCQPGCSIEETLESQLLSTLSDIRDNAGKVCLTELHPTNSPLIMTLCGSKGSNINISQMVACVGQQALNGERVPFSFDSKSLPHFLTNSIIPAAKGFVKNSFFSGMVPCEFFFHTMGGREGLVDTSVKTADSGYMQRRLVKALEDLVVCADKTVRNANNQIVQLVYGNDDLDPAEMETTESPVDFKRILESVKAQFPDKSGKALSDSELCVLRQKQLLTDNWPKCSEAFKTDFSNFMKKIEEKVYRIRKVYGNCKGAEKIERITVDQLSTFITTCVRKYKNAIVQAGTAVGAVAAQSIGEPGTQMTLKTFHFAGVASMNITQGVPRVKEIINATKNIQTPIITAPILFPISCEYARKVKARIEKTTLKDIARLTITINADNSYVKVVLNRELILKLFIEINTQSIRYDICKKLKHQPQDVDIVSRTVLHVFPNPKDLDKDENTSTALRKLLKKLEDLIIKGLPTANRVITCKDPESNLFYLCVEGKNLRDIMATYGVNGCITTSNNIVEVYETLGIEAARTTIVREIETVLKNHGMSVDIRHIMLLATQMTRTGEVLAITRNGLEKMNSSVMTLASFESTANHLYDSAYYGRLDASNGVSENIIMGMPVPVGTSQLKLVTNPTLGEDTFVRNDAFLFG